MKEWKQKDEVICPKSQSSKSQSWDSDTETLRPVSSASEDKSTYLQGLWND